MHHHPAERRRVSKMKEKNATDTDSPSSRAMRVKTLEIAWHNVDKTNVRTFVETRRNARSRASR